MRVLIIGGTHFMGPYVVKDLLAAGHEVTVFHRGQISPAKLPEQVKELLGDRDRLPEYADVLRGQEPDVVLDMMVMHEQHARDLMETFAGVARRVVMISSQDVYRAFGRVNRTEGGEVDPAPITEDSPLRANLYPYRGKTLRAEDDPQRWMDDYDKIPAERVVMGYSNLPGTVLRLPAVYGPGDRQHRMFPYLKRMLDGRPAILLEASVAGWHWTHGYVENIADAIALAVTDERASGRIYVVGEPHALTVVERVEHLVRAAHWPGRIVTVPTERLPQSLREEGNVAQHIIVDSSRIRRELAYAERIDLEEAFNRTVAWENLNPPPQIDPAFFDYEAEDKVLATL